MDREQRRVVRSTVVAACLQWILALMMWGVVCAFFAGWAYVTIHYLWG